jgi:hypothetical protein
MAEDLGDGEAGLCGVAHRGYLGGDVFPGLPPVERHYAQHGGCAAGPDEPWRAAFAQAAFDRDRATEDG